MAREQRKSLHLPCGGWRWQWGNGLNTHLLGHFSLSPLSGDGFPFSSSKGKVMQFLPQTLYAPIKTQTHFLGTCSRLCKFGAQKLKLGATGRLAA